jgi:hypothetical protein
MCWRPEMREGRRGGKRVESPRVFLLGKERADHYHKAVAHSSLRGPADDLRFAAAGHPSPGPTEDVVSNRS